MRTAREYGIGIELEFESGCENVMLQGRTAYMKLLMFLGFHEVLLKYSLNFEIFFLCCFIFFFIFSQY